MPPYERAARIAKWSESMRAHWTVENGELVNDGHGTYATTEKNYGDFELLLEYKIIANGDSGICPHGCPQVQSWDHSDEKEFPNGADNGSGGLWHNCPGAKEVFDA